MTTIILRYNPGVRFHLGLLILMTFLVCPMSSWVRATGEIRGVVLDASGGESLARVQVRLNNTPHQTVTDALGRFVLADVEPGDYDLRVSTVGYQLLKKKITLVSGEVKEFEIVLNLDTSRQTDVVEVKAGPFEVARQDSPSEVTLRGSEAKNLASVLADDPLRAVQGLPGVTSNNDFNSEFSLRGAAFHNIGVYLDDVNLHTPFHSVQGEDTSGSLTILNGDTLEGIDLHSGAFPVRYSDATAGALDLVAREGSRLKPSLRATASASNAGFLAEGPLDEARRGDWLVSARKSYLQYVLKRISTEPSLAFGFYDTQEKFSYDLNAKNHVSLGIVYGASGLDRSSAKTTLGGNTITTSDYHYTLLNLAWRYTPSERFLLTNRAAWMREKFHDRNPDDLALSGGNYGESVWNSNGTWLWFGHHPLDFGASIRRLHEDGFTNRYQFFPFAVRRLDESRGHGLRAGGFAEQSWKSAQGRVHLSVGVRWDHHSVDDVDHLSPQVALAFLPRPSTRVNLGWGRYVEYPDLRNFFFRFGSAGLLPERADHFVAAVEQDLDARTRVRVELYQRQDRDLLFRPFLEPRIIADQIFNSVPNPPLRNVLHGPARGFEVFLQRRSANRLSGWVSYAYGHSRLRENEQRIDFLALLGQGSTTNLSFRLPPIEFPSDQDQRHTVNVYLSYRVRPTVNLSVKAIYGSGFPIPGFFERRGGNYFLADSRNQVREDPYQRIDFRINKAYVYHRWKLTVYAEVVNLLNRRNMVFRSFRGFDPTTRQVSLDFVRMFPILPSAGVALDF